jgi:hypothetical protein
MLRQGMSGEEDGYAVSTNDAGRDTIGHRGIPGRRRPRQSRKERAMRGKLWFALGAAAGFVLGARAGREKYEELVVNARKVWDHPTVQEAAGVVQAQANRLYHEGKDTVNDKLSNSKLGEKLSTGSSTSDDTLATSSVTGGSGSSTSSSSPNSTGTTY